MAAFAGHMDDDSDGPSSPGSPMAICAADPYVDCIDPGDQVGQRFFGDPSFIPHAFCLFNI